MTIEMSQARLCVRAGPPARRPQLPDAHDLHRLRGGGGRARLYRADQCARQHAHARLRDPARVRYRGRRRLQPRAGRPRRTAAEEPRLLQAGEDHDRAGLGLRPRHPQRRRRGAIDRRVLDRRRLFDGGRPGRRSLGRRAQPARTRAIRARRGDLRPAHARHRPVLHGAVLPRLSARLRHRSVRQADQFVLVSTSTGRRRSAAACASASRCARISGCSCAIRLTGRSSSSTRSCATATTSIRISASSPALRPTIRPRPR